MPPVTETALPGRRAAKPHELFLSRQKFAARIFHASSQMPERSHPQFLVTGGTTDVPSIPETRRHADENVRNFGAWHLHDCGIRGSQLRSVVDEQRIGGRQGASHQMPGHVAKLDAAGFTVLRADEEISGRIQ
jgi:hypothetical protein